jgi:hypothetical protein
MALWSQATLLRHCLCYRATIACQAIFEIEFFIFHSTLVLMVQVRVLVLPSTNMSIHNRGLSTITSTLKLLNSEQVMFFYRQ